MEARAVLPHPPTADRGEKGGGVPARAQNHPSGVIKVASGMTVVIVVDVVMLMFTTLLNEHQGQPC